MATMTMSNRNRARHGEATCGYRHCNCDSPYLNTPTRRRMKRRERAAWKAQARLNMTEK